MTKPEMTQVIYATKRSLADAAELTDEEIEERHLKHIAEITKDLAPLKDADLTEDQQDFLDRKGRYAPYRPSALHRVEEEEEDEEYW